MAGGGRSVQDGPIGDAENGLPFRDILTNVTVMDSGRS